MRRRSDLVAILLNPSQEGGTLSKSRVELARKHLGFSSAIIANLCATPTKNSKELSLNAGSSDPWLEGRSTISDLVSRADGVLLAYGTSPLSGKARVHHRAQLDWLHSFIHGTRTRLFHAWKPSDTCLPMAPICSWSSRGGARA